MPVTEEIEHRLLLGETTLVLSSLRVAKSRTSGSTSLSIGIFVRIYDEFRNAWKLREIRARSLSMDFPLDRRMRSCVTEGRILLWRDLRFGRPMRYLGDVSRDRIRSAELPYASHGQWRIVKILMHDGGIFHLLIDSASATTFETVLNAAT
jgi:hypothetical protein